MNKLNLNSFFPEDMLQLTKVEQTEEAIHIYLKSKTKNCVCPKCGQSTEQYHGTYVRHVQDLSILGKNVQLHIKAHEYKCTNTDCNASTIAENFNGFLNYYSRMTERCADFICSLALETSCEGCFRICKALGIKTSGDTVMRLLLKRYQAMENDFMGDKIGVDDFAYKKRHTYGTIIVDEEIHTPIALLDGRDGTSLRKWLKNNKHIKVITRDRASAYAKVIAEELPDAMQVADRFYLHQNLLEAIKKALNHGLPATIKIPHTKESERERETGKKIAQDVGNPPNYSEKRYKMICQIQQLLKEGCSYREIARRMGVGRNTIAKYRKGDPKELSMYGIHQSKLDIFHDFILECLYSGKSKSKTVKSVYAKGYTGSKSNAFDYFVKIEQREGKTFEPQPYIRTQTETLKYRVGSKRKTADYITREGVFKHIWM